MARREMPGASSGGLLRMAERAGLRKGLNGSKGWFYLGTGLWTLRTVRRMAERKPEVLVSEKLKPGERIVIANGRVTIDDGGAASAPALAQGRRAGKKVGKKASKKAAKQAAKAGA